MTDLARLRWRCRRGTKELDLVLLRFLDQDYSHLSADGRSCFEELLAEQDPDLAGWIWGGDPPPGKWKWLVERIQAVASRIGDSHSGSDTGTRPGNGKTVG